VMGEIRHGVEGKHNDGNRSRPSPNPSQNIHQIKAQYAPVAPPSSAIEGMSAKDQSNVKCYEQKNIASMLLPMF
jgi:hypothetical protein